MPSQPAVLAEAADALWGAAKTGHYIPPLRATYPGLDAADAYAIQRRNTERRLAAGRRVVGCKIGLTARAVQAQLGVDQPDFGVLFDDMSFGDAEPISMQRLHQPKVEAEIAFVLGRDLDMGNPGHADVVKAVDHVLPAIEIVGSRIAGWDIRFVDTVADNASSGAFVLGGSPRLLREVDLRLCGMVMNRRGEPVSVGAGAACLGNPINAVVWLARTMAALGQPLRAGDLVLSGALGPMVPVAPGDVFETHINGLGSVKAVFETAAAVAKEST
ncbi:2-keto-4-pentenoate hydratase [Variovorax fucosicus]|uniref:2-keto-4-pentenoate hydratase n=1 Tax=Variovorax fucosicus TaxID=3053517 RepID=UPI002575FAD5|nr:2-keto-4-pentenoate hydratase [Variovorax sp. J22G47]MDM0056490.1 2-keto-4-pentenoate hydratase [Variovorax sp. J22G47]